MLNQKLLFLMTNESEIEEACNFVESIQKSYKDIICDAIYINDILKYEMFPTSIEGGIINSAPSFVMKEYKNIENNKYKRIEPKLNALFNKVFTVEGDTISVLLDEMKAYDCLVVIRNPNITADMKEVLRNHYKPLIILTNNNIEYNFDKILMLNDGGYKVNKSIYSFFHVFGTKHIDVLRVNIEEKDRLTERFGDICNIIDKTGDEEEIISSMVNDYDMIVMGDVKYSMILERLTNKIGLKIIEKTNKPIFIG